MLKDLGTFGHTHHNVHRFTLNLHLLKIIKVERLPENINCWGAVVFEKWVKLCHENTFFKLKIVSFCLLISNSTPADDFFREAFYHHYLQTVWVWCKSVDHVFCVLQKVPSRRFHQTIPNLGIILERVQFRIQVRRTHWTHPKLGRVTRPNSR